MEMSLGFEHLGIGNSEMRVAAGLKSVFAPIRASDYAKNASEAQSEPRITPKTLLEPKTRLG